MTTSIITIPLLSKTLKDIVIKLLETPNDICALIDPVEHLKPKDV